MSEITTSKINYTHRYDGFQDIFGGANRWHPITPPIYGDNRLYSNMSRYWQAYLGHTDHQHLYITNGVAATIIDRPADDAFSQGLDIDGDDDDLMQDDLDRLNVAETFANALRWARLFGASAVAVLAKDGGTWIDPLNLDNLEIVEDLIVYDLRYIKPTDQLYTDPGDPMFGKPEIYKLYPPGADPFEIHETRLIPFTGEPLPLSTMHRINVWWVGKSVLDACCVDLHRLDQALYWSSKLLERKQQGIYGMHGLGDLIAQDMEMVIQKRIGNVDFARNNLNSVVIDAEDTFRVENLGLDNMQNVIGEFQTAVCADAQMPSVILFGKSATSLNTTGAGELEQYYGMVNKLRKRNVQPALERLVSILWNQSELKSHIPDEWEIVWRPLWVPPAKDKAETDRIEAQTEEIEINNLLKLVDAGILMPEEVRKIIVNTFPDMAFVAQADLSQGGDIAYARSVGGGDDNV